MELLKQNIDPLLHAIVATVASLGVCWRRSIPTPAQRRCHPIVCLEFRHSVHADRQTVFRFRVVGVFISQSKFIYKEQAEMSTIHNHTCTQPPPPFLVLVYSLSDEAATGSSGVPSPGSPPSSGATRRRSPLRQQQQQQARHRVGQLCPLAKSEPERAKATGGTLRRSSGMAIRSQSSETSRSSGVITRTSVAASEQA